MQRTDLPRSRIVFRSFLCDHWPWGAKSSRPTLWLLSLAYSPAFWLCVHQTGFKSDQSAYNPVEWFTNWSRVRNQAVTYIPGLPLLVQGELGNRSTCTTWIQGYVILWLGQLGKYFCGMFCIPFLEIACYSPEFFFFFFFLIIVINWSGLNPLRVI